MISLLLAAVSLAQGQATVGDTVWVATTVPLPSRMIIRPQAWDLGDLGRVLGPPIVDLDVDSATIRYPLVLWYPGEHEVRIPGPIVVSPEGHSDTLPTRRTVLRVASVLPADQPRDSLEPRPASQLIPQAARSPLALLVLELSVGTAAGLMAWMWRRRDRRRRTATAAPPVAPVADLDDTLAAWSAYGELRAAVDGWAHRVEAWYPDATRRPELVASWLERAERAGFTDHRAVDELEFLLGQAPVLSRPRRDPS